MYFEANHEAIERENTSYVGLEVTEITIIVSDPLFHDFCLLDSEIKKSEES